MSYHRVTCVLLLLASPAMAQQSAGQHVGAPAVSGMPSDPNLVVDTVRMQNGSRLSQLIGSAIYNDHHEKIGSIDDLVARRPNIIVEAIISVGGFLGVGSKLVAIPYEELSINLLHKDGEHVILPGATKDKLSQMTTFTYDR